MLSSRQWLKYRGQNRNRNWCFCWNYYNRAHCVLLLHKKKILQNLKQPSRFGVEIRESFWEVLRSWDCNQFLIKYKRLLIIYKIKNTNNTNIYKRQNGNRWTAQVFETNYWEITHFCIQKSKSRRRHHVLDLQRVLQLKHRSYSKQIVNKISILSFANDWNIRIL